ncbi:hypothetical protein Tco_0996560, partial [Tanacetum coccineum]
GGAWLEMGVVASSVWWWQWLWRDNGSSGGVRGGRDGDDGVGWWVAGCGSEDGALVVVWRRGGVGSEGGDQRGGDDGDGVEVVLWWLRWGGSRRRWRRVAASGYEDRVDRAMRIAFGFGRNARRKTFPAAADGKGGWKFGEDGGGRE